LISFIFFLIYIACRYESYTQEFTFLFEKLENFALASRDSTTPHSCSLEADTADCALPPASPNIDEGVKICLEIFYYWVNFAPLSRGSAATGYSVLIGCIASLGEVPSTPLPRGVQIDWLGMLSPSPGHFVAAAFPYVAARTPLENVLDAGWEQQQGTGTAAFSGVFRTARDILYVLNLEDE
jgi:hypothetical protein